MSPIATVSNSKMILHICSREMLRALRDQILRISGFKVESTLSPADGISLFSRKQFDLVLIDVEDEAKVFDAEKVCREMKTARPGQLVAFVCSWRVTILTDCPDEVIRTDFDPGRFVRGVYQLASKRIH